jgi:sensor histidine kinase regulating citrate/malate metabolism
VIFIFLEVFTTPYKYETLFVNRVFGSFAVVNGSVLILEMLLGTIYYHIVKNLLHSSELQIRSNLLEMQESAFEKQQRYMDENARIRHDFKHTLRSLHIMAEENDIEQIRKVLDEYVSTLPEKEIINYCNHYALNAMLNYYAANAASRDCEINFRIDLPSQGRLPLSDTELCSVIGNILDNAVHAVENQTEGEKRIDLTTRVMNDKDLYITAVNTFDGNVKRRNYRYMTTKKRGSGIGLRSIASIIELHGGMSEFHHEGTLFYSDIFLPLTNAASTGEETADDSGQMK